MHLLSLLEKIATSTNHHLSLDDCLENQPLDVKQAFLTNNAWQIKNMLGNTVNLADRNKVVFIE